MSDFKVGDVVKASFVDGLGVVERVCGTSLAFRLRGHLYSAHEMTCELVERPAVAAPDDHRVGDVLMSPMGNRLTITHVHDSGRAIATDGDDVAPAHVLLRGGWTRLPRESMATAEEPPRAHWTAADEAPPITAHLPSLRRALEPVRFGGLFRAAPEPSVADDRYPHRCHQGHRAWAPFGAARECPTCDAIRVVRNDEPWAVRPGVVKGEPCMHVDHRGAVYTHPTRDGAIALWRAAEVARLDREGRA